MIISILGPSLGAVPGLLLGSVVLGISVGAIPGLSLSAVPELLLGVVPRLSLGVLLGLSCRRSEVRKVKRSEFCDPGAITWSIAWHDARAVAGCVAVCVAWIVAVCVAWMRVLLEFCDENNHALRNWRLPLLANHKS